MSVLFKDKMLLDDIDYFIYETDSLEIIRGENSERIYKINTKEEMLSYFKKEYNWD